jgi:hypothetical protein
MTQALYAHMSNKKKPSQKRLVEWLKVKALSSNSSTAKKKKRGRKRAQRGWVTYPKPHSCSLYSHGVPELSLLEPPAATRSLLLPGKQPSVGGLWRAQGCLGWGSPGKSSWDDLLQEVTSGGSSRKWGACSRGSPETNTQKDI